MIPLCSSMPAVVLMFVNHRGHREELCNEGES